MKTAIFPVFIVTLFARWALSWVLPFERLGLCDGPCRGP